MSWGYPGNGEGPSGPFFLGGSVKSRQGFVSNSSSSSFIVVGNTGNRESLPKHLLDSEGVLVISEDTGTTEFGWGPETLRSIEERICLCYVAARYTEDPDRSRERVTELLMREPGVTEVQVRFGDGDYGCYIDHQSVDDLIQMFEGQDLEAFLFDAGSYIEIDNDNH
jgi:hypothetical protein